MYNIAMHNREQIINGRKINLILRDDVDESIVNEVFKFREYRATVELIKEAKGVVLDVGAHAGYFSLWATAQNPKVKIYALEPIKENFEFLQKNIAKNKFKNIKPENVALTKKSGEINIFLSGDSHNHSLLPISDKTQSVKSVNLADYIKKNKIKNISLLKIDIEGGEYEIFENLEKEIFSKIENVFLEYHQSENRNFKVIENILRENGFTVEIFPSHFDKTMGFLLARNKRKSRTNLQK